MDYTELIAPQHRTQPNFIAWLNSALQPIIDAQAVLNVMAGQFNIETAVGVQLDTIGAVLGISRTVSFQPSGGESPILTDDMYRFVLHAKILANQWDGTREGYNTAITTLFSAYPIAVFDHVNMSIEIILNLSEANSLIADLLTHGYLFPTPVGISTTLLAARVGSWAWYYYNQQTWTDISGKTWTEAAAGL